MKIYVAGPYSHPTEEGRLANVRRALDAAVALIRAGHTPFVPHLSHYLDERAEATGARIDYEEWLRQDREWLDLCEGFLYLAPSPGADRELERANERKLLIRLSPEEFGRASTE